MNMKTTAVSMVLAGTVLVSAWGTPCNAQSEVDPDHFEMNNVEPVPQPHAKLPVQQERTAVHFRGKFNLPHTAECAGKRLLPGEYLLALSSEGKNIQVTVSQKGRAIRFAAHVAARVGNAGQNTLILQRGGTLRKVAAIDLKDFSLILCPGFEGKVSLENQSRGTERLPIT